MFPLSNSVQTTITSPDEFTAIAGNSDSLEVLDRFIEPKREKERKASHRKENIRHLLNTIVSLSFSRIIQPFIALFLKNYDSEDRRDTIFFFFDGGFFHTGTSLNRILAEFSSLCQVRSSICAINSPLPYKIQYVFL